MEPLLQFWKNQWTAYPEWLVVSSVVIAGGVLLWLALRFFAWLVKWLLIGAAVCLVLGVLVYLAG